MHATYLRIKEVKSDTHIVLEHLLSGDVIGHEVVSDIAVLISDWRIFRGKTTVALPGYLVYNCSCCSCHGVHGCCSNHFACARMW